MSAKKKPKPGASEAEWREYFQLDAEKRGELDSAQNEMVDPVPLIRRRPKD